MATLKCKRGDTLRIAGQHTNIDGSPASLTGTTISSAMRFNTSRVVLLPTVVNAAQGTFTLLLSAVETAALAVSPWLSDVQFTSASGDVISTETFLILIEEDITSATD